MSNTANLAMDPHNRITPAKLRAWGVGWSESKITNFFQGSASSSAFDIATDPEIPVKERLWVLTHALAYKDIWLTYNFALWCANQACEVLNAEWHTKLDPLLEQVRGCRADTTNIDSAIKTARAANEAAGEDACYNIIAVYAARALHVTALAAEAAVSYAHAIKMDKSASHEDIAAYCAHSAAHSAARAVVAYTSASSEDTYVMACYAAYAAKLLED